MKVFVDTSAMLALLDASDAHHQAAAQLFRQLGESADELVTHNYVTLEAIALVRHRLGGDATAALIDRLLPSMTTEWVDGGVHDAALEAWRARGWAGSFVDQVSFVLMRRLAMTHAFAFDRDFETAGFSGPVVAEQDRPRLSEEPAAYGDVGVANIVSVAEIARRSGRSVSTVQSWRRRSADFPAAIADLAAGPIWDWDEVEPWIKRRAAPARRGRRRDHADSLEVEGADLETPLEGEGSPVPEGWSKMRDGRPMPNVVRAIRLARTGR